MGVIWNFLSKCVIIKLQNLEIYRIFACDAAAQILQLNSLIDDTEAQNLLSKQNVIEEILENFDFEKVHAFMVEMNWGWMSTGMHVPDVDDIKKQAVFLLNSVMDMPDDICYQGTGGLLAMKFCETVELMFVPAEWSCDRRL